jgi:hypothetical protein
VSAPSRSAVFFARAVPFVAALVIVVGGYVWFVQPRISAYRQNLAEVTRLETRVRALHDAVKNGGGAPSPDGASALALFDPRLSTDDKVPEVVERLARLAGESAPAGRVRGVTITTGDPVQAQAANEASSPGSGGVAIPDPRFGLFPGPVAYTPVTVSFESSYEAIAGFAWRLRDLPTIVEVRSVELTRGLPLMRVAVQMLVFQGGEARVAPSSLATGLSAQPSSSTAPRVAGFPAPGGSRP